MGRSFLTIVGGFVHQAAFLLLQRPPVSGEGVEGEVKIARAFFPPKGQWARQGRVDKRNKGPGLWSRGGEGWKLRVRTRTDTKGWRTWEGASPGL